MPDGILGVTSIKNIQSLKKEKIMLLEATSKILLDLHKSVTHDNHLVHFKSSLNVRFGMLMHDNKPINLDAQ